MPSLLDQIFIRDLRIHALIGVNPHEQDEPQEVLLNITLWVQNLAALHTDKLEDTVSYHTLMLALVKKAQEKHYQLIEKLAQDLLKTCFELDSRIEEVQLTLEKPAALFLARSAGFTLFRNRSNHPSP